MEMLQVWQVVVLPFLAAALGGWFTAHFALHRFFREKVWERKTQTYTAIFEALHDMSTWFDEHWTAEERDREIPAERQSELTIGYQRARANLRRRLTSETWLIPAECNDRLRKMMRELSVHHETWFEELDAGSHAISVAISDLRKLVRNDLGLDRKPWWSAEELRIKAGHLRFKLMRPRRENR